MPKEQLHHEQRAMERRVKSAPEDEERKRLEEEYWRKRGEIDGHFNAQSIVFHEKYAVTFETPAPSTPTSAPTTPTLAATTAAPVAEEITQDPPQPSTTETPPAPLTKSSEHLMFVR